MSVRYNPLPAHSNGFYRTFIPTLPTILMARMAPALGKFRWLTVVSPEQPEGAELCLEPNENPAAQTYQAAIFEQGIPETSFGVSDVQKEVEALKVKHVEFSMEPTDMGSVVLAVFNDTCGNLIQMHQSQEENC